MKNHTAKLLALTLSLALLLTGCKKDGPGTIPDRDPGLNGTPPSGSAADLGGFDEAFGEDRSAELYAGYFEDTTQAQDITVTCLSGTQGAYTIEGSTLTFTSVTEDSVYAVSGKWNGNIVIDAGDGHKFDLELHGFSLICASTNPITVLSGDEVSVTAKKDHENYIYDTREAIDDTDETFYSAAVYSLVDLEIAGKGALTVVSENNNGIHTKDDLQVKNLTLTVTCVDNALKGNDSVSLEACTTTLIATGGDGIKTTNSDISDKGNQRGTVTVAGGTHTIYAACDGIDAAYDAVIDDASTVLNIYTDKYSAYSEEVTAVAENVYYIRYSSDAYKYSIKYYNSDTDFVWVNAEYHSEAMGGRSSYYYYSFPKMARYEKLQFFIYSAEMTQGQESDYLAASDYLSPSTGYDTLAISARGDGLSYSWTNFGTQMQEGMGGRNPGGMGGKNPGGMGQTPPGGFGGMGNMGGFGGMGGGNTDKGDYSTKGIKAANEIRIENGNITIKAYDDAIHANSDTTLENGATPLGNVTINGGTVTVYSNDDGIHADGTLTVNAGTVSVTDSYEGLEGTRVSILGGYVSVIAKDDGINGTATDGTAIAIGGGTLYIYCSGDGIDSNSRTSYEGIAFSGGNTVVISTSGGNSAIDTERGYRFTGGRVIAVMPTGGMSGEATNCADFSDIGTKKSISLSADGYLTVSMDGEAAATIKCPKSMSALVICLGSSAATVSAEKSTSANLDANGVSWH